MNQSPMHNHQYHIMLSGGGTGGHIFPAVAIADGLKKAFPQAEFLFVGALGRMEMEKVPQAGYKIIGLWISGIQRKITTDNLAFPFKLLSSLYKARKIINQFKPDVVIGTGGYASGPLLHVASKKNIPTLILEQNSYPGLTNKWLARSVNSICVGYPSMERYFPTDKITLTGSPIRKEILQSKANKPKGCSFFKLNKDLPTLLIIGGSQGARSINLAILQNLNKLLNEHIQILWQTGKSGFQEALKAKQACNKPDQLVIKEFIQRMDLAYASADIIVSRAGAIAIAEIVAVKKPAIFIPLPSAAEDHQTKNAQALANREAGVLINEENAQTELGPTIIALVHDAKKRQLLSANLSAFDYPNATQSIVNKIISLINTTKP